MGTYFSTALVLLIGVAMLSHEACHAIMTEPNAIDPLYEYNTLDSIYNAIYNDNVNNIMKKTYDNEVDPTIIKHYRESPIEIDPLSRYTEYYLNLIKHYALVQEDSHDDFFKKHKETLSLQPSSAQKSGLVELFNSSQQNSVAVCFTGNVFYWSYGYADLHIERNSSTRTSDANSRGIYALSYSNIGRAYYWRFKRKDSINKKLLLWIGGEPGCNLKSGVLSSFTPCMVTKEGHLLSTFLNEDGTFAKFADVIYTSEDSPLEANSENKFQKHIIPSTTMSYIRIMVLLGHIFNKYPDYKSYEFHIGGDRHGATTAVSLTSILLQKALNDVPSYLSGFKYEGDTIIKRPSSLILVNPLLGSRAQSTSFTKVLDIKTTMKENRLGSLRLFDEKQIDNTKLVLNMNRACMLAAEEICKKDQGNNNNRSYSNAEYTPKLSNEKCLHCRDLCTNLIVYSIRKMGRDPHDLSVFCPDGKCNNVYRNYGDLLSVKKFLNTNAVREKLDKSNSSDPVCIIKRLYDMTKLGAFDDDSYMPHASKLAAERFPILIITGRRSFVYNYMIAETLASMIYESLKRTLSEPEFKKILNKLNKYDGNPLKATVRNLMKIKPDLSKTLVAEVRSAGFVQGVSIYSSGSYIHNDAPDIITDLVEDWIINYRHGINSLSNHKLVNTLV